MCAQSVTLQLTGKAVFNTIQCCRCGGTPACPWWAQTSPSPGSGSMMGACTGDRDSDDDDSDDDDSDDDYNDDDDDDDNNDDDDDDNGDDGVQVRGGARHPGPAPGRGAHCRDSG